MMQFPLIKPLLVTALLMTGTAHAAPDAREVLAVSPVDDIVARYPAGSAFSKVVTSSIQQAITEPVETIGKQMARFLSPESPGGQ